MAATRLVFRPNVGCRSLRPSRSAIDNLHLPLLHPFV
jgi:hypothetical protein